MNTNIKAESTFQSMGYTGTARYSPEDQLWVGRLAGTEDSVIFGGESLEEAKRDFEAAVILYSEICEKVGKAPEQPEFN